MYTEPKFITKSEERERPRPYSDHEDLHGLLAHLGVETAVLVGCSHGGKIALDFALVYPEMVAGLVLSGSGLGGYEFTMEGMVEKAEAMSAAYERGEIDLAAEISTQVWYDGLTRRPEQVHASGRAKISQLIGHTFYRYERIIEDIAEFCEHIFLSTGDGEDRKWALELLQANFQPNDTIDIAVKLDNGE